MKNLSTTTMEKSIAAAEEIIARWDINSSKCSNTTTLFGSNRGEAHAFVAAVTELKQAMHLFLNDKSNSTHSKLLSRAHQLIVTAMARLMKELHHILPENRDRLYLAPLPGEKSQATVAMDDLRSIAKCMMTSGYTKECVRIYATERRAYVDEALDGFCHAKLCSSHLKNLEWEDAQKLIRKWVMHSRFTVRGLFAGERFVSDYIFDASNSIKDHIFAEITKEPAVHFLQFPESVASKKKTTADKIFSYLNLYDSIVELSPEIESLFSQQSTAEVLRQERASRAKLAGVIRASLDEFEKAMEKDWSKEIVAGGGVHPLTAYVMDYLTVLADYVDILGEILADHPHHQPKPLPGPFVKLISPVQSAPSSPARFGNTHEAEEAIPQSAVTTRVAWVLLVLLCKLDRKAEMYKNSALSYLFLANNVRYMVNKVLVGELRHLLGEDWVKRHAEKARSFAGSYERLGWRKVVEAIPTDPVGLAEAGGVEAVVGRMMAFNEAFEDAYKKQSDWVVVDKWLRDELQVSIAGKIVIPYREFYETCVGAMRAQMGFAKTFGVVKFAPDVVADYLSDLFREVSGSTSGSVSGSGSDCGSGSSKGWSVKSG